MPSEPFVVLPRIVPFVTTTFFLTIGENPGVRSMPVKSSDVIREAMRHAEMKQAAQLQIALAADTRAMTLCVACAGIGGVLIGLLGNIKTGPNVEPVIMMALSFFLASALAAWSARPISFAAPGQDFSDFESDIAEDRPLDHVLLELGKHLDDCARENEVRAQENAKFFRAAMAIAALAPLIGVLAMVAG